MLNFRDLLGLVTAFVVTILATLAFTLPPAEIASHDLKLYGEIYDNHPVFIRILGLTSFLVPAFLAVWAGAAVSTASHQVRNGWIFTLIGVLFYAYLHYEVLFIPHRETDDSATYVLFTSPQIYLLAGGGVLASLLVSYRQCAKVRRNIKKP